MRELNLDPEVNRFTRDGPLDEAAALRIVESLQAQFQQRRMGRFIVLHKESGERMGWCGLKPTADEKTADLGYRFMQRFWGQGFATEASQTFIRYGFDDLGLERLIAEVDVGNARSFGVLRRLGFTFFKQEGAIETWELRSAG
jgi:ribosomal-protein-alanine N-acetyltransferase